MFLTKSVEDYFQKIHDDFRSVVEKFEINRKPWKNEFGQIS